MTDDLQRDLDRAAALDLVAGTSAIVVSDATRRALVAWLEEHPS